MSAHLNKYSICAREGGAYCRGRLSSRYLHNTIKCQLITYFKNLSEVEDNLYWVHSFNLQVIVNHLTEKDSDGRFARSVYLRQAYSIFLNSFKEHILNLRYDEDIDSMLVKLNKEESIALEVLGRICYKYDDEVDRIESNLVTYGKASNFIYGHTKTYVIERLRVLLTLIKEFDEELSRYGKCVKKIIKAT